MPPRLSTNTVPPRSSSPAAIVISPRPRCSAARISQSLPTGGPSPCTSPIAGDETSGSEALQCRTQACTRSLGLLPALALLLDHLLRGARHEVGIAELGVDLAHLVGELPDLLLQPRAFRLEVDHLTHRQGVGRLA